jgi:hypothetical protein
MWRVDTYDSEGWTGTEEPHRVFSDDCIGKCHVEVFPYKI